MSGKERKERQGPSIFPLGVLPAVRVISDWNSASGVQEIQRRNPFVKNFGIINPELFELYRQKNLALIAESTPRAAIWTEATMLTYAVVNQTATERGVKMPRATKTDIDLALKYLTCEDTEFDLKIREISAFDDTIQDIVDKVENYLRRFNNPGSVSYFNQHRPFIFGAVAAIYIPLRIAASRR